MLFFCLLYLKKSWILTIEMNIPTTAAVAYTVHKTAFVIDHQMDTASRTEVTVCWYTANVCSNVPQAPTLNKRWKTETQYPVSLILLKAVKQPPFHSDTSAKRSLPHLHNDRGQRRGRVDQ